MVPILHRKCGGQVAWYLRDEGKGGDILLSKDYMRMDGTQPKYGETVREKCGSCGALILDAFELERDFSDKRPFEQPSAPSAPIKEKAWTSK